MYIERSMKERDITNERLSGNLSQQVSAQSFIRDGDNERTDYCAVSGRATESGMTSTSAP